MVKGYSETDMKGRFFWSSKALVNLLASECFEPNDSRCTLFLYPKILAYRTENKQSICGWAELI